MTRAMLEELGLVAQLDSDAIVDQYAWPPRAPLTAEEVREAERLRVLASRIFYRSVCTPGASRYPLDGGQP